MELVIGSIETDLNKNSTKERQLFKTGAKKEVGALSESDYSLSHEEHVTLANSTPEDRLKMLER